MAPSGFASTHALGQASGSRRAPSRLHDAFPRLHGLASGGSRWRTSYREEDVLMACGSFRHMGWEGLSGDGPRLAGYNSSERVRACSTRRNVLIRTTDSGIAGSSSTIARTRTPYRARLAMQAYRIPPSP